MQTTWCEIQDTYLGKMTTLADMCIEVDAWKDMTRVLVATDTVFMQACQE